MVPFPVAIAVTQLPNGMWADSVRFEDLTPRQIGALLAAVGSMCLLGTETVLVSENVRTFVARDFDHDTFAGERFTLEALANRDGVKQRGCSLFRELARIQDGPPGVNEAQHAELLRQAVAAPVARPALSLYPIGDRGAGPVLNLRLARCTPRRRDQLAAVGKEFALHSALDGGALTFFALDPDQTRAVMQRIAPIVSDALVA